jgi:hypothetical protein
MKKLYREYFHIDKNENIHEKAMLMRAGTTVATMVLCLIIMTLTAYAYFTSDVSSPSNLIRSAAFKTEITIVDQNSQPVSVLTSDHKSHYADLKAGTTYYVTVRHTSSSSTETGFLILTAEKCGSKYHTIQLGRDGNGLTKSINFSLKPTDDTRITLKSSWGTSSFYNSQTQSNPLYITQDRVVELLIGVQNLQENTPEETTEQATQTDTKTETTQTEPPKDTETSAQTTEKAPETTVETTELTTTETEKKDPETTVSEAEKDEPAEETTGAETTGADTPESQAEPSDTTDNEEND